MNNQDLETLTDKAADLIIKSRKMVVFTGAGISTESGIPDFRSPGGIWERFDPDDFTYQKFVPMMPLLNWTGWVSWTASLPRI